MSEGERSQSRTRLLPAAIRSKDVLPAALLILALRIVASLPGEDPGRLQAAPHQLLLSDPAMHALTFALLALLVARGWHRPSGQPEPLAMALQVAFYALAAAGTLWQKKAKPPRFLGIPFSLCLVNPCCAA